MRREPLRAWGLRRFFHGALPGLVLLGLWGQPARVLGQSYEGARLLAFAEAQRALTTGNDSIYINPAGLALAQVYSLELGYLDDARGSDRRFNASVIDSQAGPISGGLAYTYSNRRPDVLRIGEERLKGHRIEGAVATRIANNAALGATIRYLNFDREAVEPGADRGDFRLLTFDVGLQWRIVDDLSLAVVGYNLTNPDRDEAPISWGGGLGFSRNGFSLEADLRHDLRDKKIRVSGGFGYVLGDLLPIRVGVSYDRATQAWSLAGGIGLVYERAAIDVGYRQRLNGERGERDDDDRILGVAIRMLAF